MLLMGNKRGAQQQSTNEPLENRGVLADDECADFYRKMWKIPAICGSVWETEVIF